MKEIALDFVFGYTNCMYSTHTQVKGVVQERFKSYQYLALCMCISWWIVREREDVGDGNVTVYLWQLQWQRVSTSTSFGWESWKLGERRPEFPSGGVNRVSHSHIDIYYPPSQTETAPPQKRKLLCRRQGLYTVQDIPASSTPFQ